MLRCSSGSSTGRSASMTSASVTDMAQIAPVDRRSVREACRVGPISTYRA